VKNARTYLYAYLIALVWALAACVLALWFANGRPWSALLLGSLVPWRLAAGFALVTVGLWIALRDRAAVLRFLEVFERLRSKLLGPLEPLLRVRRSEKPAPAHTVVALNLGDWAELAISLPVAHGQWVAAAGFGVTVRNGSKKARVSGFHRVCDLENSNCRWIT